MEKNIYYLDIFAFVRELFIQVSPRLDAELGVTGYRTSRASLVECSPAIANLPQVSIGNQLLINSQIQTQLSQSYKLTS